MRPIGMVRPMRDGEANEVGAALELRSRLFQTGLASLQLGLGYGYGYEVRYRVRLRLRLWLRCMVTVQLQQLWL